MIGELGALDLGQIEGKRRNCAELRGALTLIDFAWSSASFGAVQEA
jgi:hypothetical protein